MVLCPCTGAASLLGESQRILQTKRSWCSSSGLLWDANSDAKGVSKRHSEGCGMPEMFLKAPSLQCVLIQLFAILCCDLGAA